MERWQKQAIIRDLKKKMVFLLGPRQTGKTTLSKAVAEKFSSSFYLTYDSLDDREVMLRGSFPAKVELIILDEIHKMAGWKNYLKGVYDTKLPHQKFLITGSARLEIFTQVGDSLAGRYFLHRLMPLSPAECEKVGVPYTLDRFLERGGFPEPFLAETVVDANRWRLQYVDSLLREDVLNFENIQNVRAIRLVFDLLRRRVGSPISFSSIAGDVAISPNTVKRYIEILEALYIVFRITPFSNNIARSLLKEPKIYFFDTGLVVGDEGVKFENLVATCLLKHTFSRIDYEAKNVSLNYLQTKESHEVDFALIEDDRVEQMVEVKCGKSLVGSGLKYFHNKYDLSATQVVKELRHSRQENGINIIVGKAFLQALEL